MDVAGELKRLIDDVLSDDPKVALIALRKLTDDELPWIEHKVVSLARCADWNWAMIGRLLQRERSSVRMRFNNTRIAMRPVARSLPRVLTSSAHSL
ncbi:MAG: hypothetical protein ABIR32_22045 [Ilumatobacteraceae bacterium]